MNDKPEERVAQEYLTYEPPTATRLDDVQRGTGATSCIDGSADSFTCEVGYGN
jgi:hypothetical protein